ncbi:hypothetical protein OPV22_018040 [Ensete ventricosum]|uniref:Secreted protein n=1 Tax=Ensete ventricosum TaxID=4639 RepID=A0AAV8QV27_ENSVE|nr:hypothetical protein OPV22_018040 [Ensete ventricosum]
MNDPRWLAGWLAFGLCTEAVKPRARETSVRSADRGQARSSSSSSSILGRANAFPDLRRFGGDSEIGLAGFAGKSTRRRLGLFNLGEQIGTG